MIIIEYLIILLLATYFLKFFVKKRYELGEFFHILDLPQKGKIHKKTTPLVGSFPLIILSVVLLIYFSFADYNQIIIWIFLYSYLFFFMGYVDDRFRLNAYLKLSISLIIIIFAVNSYNELAINKIYIEFIDKHIFLENYKIFFSALCILLLMNSLNLTDGINGLASGFASCWLLSLALITNDQKIFILLLTLSTFMFINTYLIIKGNYFLGDSGTLFLGSLVGILTIFIYNNHLKFGNFIPVEKIFVFFMVPGIDMFRLFLTRLVKKKDPFGGDLNHLHHIMLKRFTLYQSLIIYLIIFLSTNLFSYFNIINPILVIIGYLTLYVFFIFFSKEKFENSSK